MKVHSFITSGPILRFPQNDAMLPPNNSRTLVRSQPNTINGESVFMTQITRRLLLSVVLISLCAQGCHRGYYRRQADAEAQRLVQQKSSDPRWNSEDGTIDIDPQSRMFDPFSSDHPPIPPDDETSHQLMHCVDGKEGYPHWHANGDTSYVENPEWRSYLPMNEKGQVVISLDQAYELALIHSPVLQQQREELYLSALDVSLERFGFDTQLFAGLNGFFSTQGRFRNGLPPNDNSQTLLSTSLGSNGQGISFEKLGITGTDFMVGIANSIMWNFAGDNTQTASSLINFSIVQPLLRDAGRKRIMESLTLAERTLLANVRQLDRFRRGFFLEVITGRNAGAGPSRNGFFLGRPVGASLAVGGYLGLLEQQQLIRIQEFNVRQLENELEKLREFYIRERIDSLQVRQFENDVYGSQNALLRSRTNYETALDQFKQDLGLPPDLDVIISDPALDQFELLSDEMTAHQEALYALQNKTGNALIDLGDLVPDIPSAIPGADPADAPEIQWPEDLNQKVLALEPLLTEALDIIEDLQNKDRQQLERDFQRLDAAREDRIKYLKRLSDAVERGEILSDVEPGILQPDSIPTGDQLRDLLEKLFVKFKNYRQAMEVTREVIRGFAEDRKQLDSDVALRNYIRSELLEMIPDELTDFSNTLLEMSLLQAQARANSVQLADVQLNDATAFRIAKCFRRDLMNARAALVDQWRQIEFVADQLESQFDLVFDGDIGSATDNPFKLRYETGQLRAGFRFDAPIVRLAERNNYRQALIDYQQARRAYYQFEDEINSNLRFTLRNLNLNKILYELNRKTIQISIEEVELARFRLEEPARPGVTRSSLGATTARDLTTALNRLQNAQSGFLNVWVDYEVLRRSLDFDLGTMQVDETGRWIDPGQIDDSIAARAAALMGIDLNSCNCYGVGIGEVGFRMEGVEFDGSLQMETAPDQMDEPAENSDPDALPFEPGTTDPDSSSQIDDANQPNLGTSTSYFKS